MNAIARRLAVMSAIGIPLNAFGTLLRASCSRSPAKRTIARPKPSDVENAYHAACPRLKSFVTTVRATPRTAQFVVISGRKIPSRAQG